MKILIKDNLVNDVVEINPIKVKPNCLLMVFGSWDYVYEHFPAFLGSAKIHAENHAVHLHIINPISDSFAICQLWQEKFHHEFSCSFEMVELPDENFIKLYTSNVRFYRIGQLLEKYRQPIMAFDIDSMINAKFTLSNELQDCDFSLFLRMHYPNQEHKVLVSSVLFNATPLSYEFLVNYGKYFMKHYQEHKLFWYFDQVVMGQLLPAFAANKAVKFLPLPKTYIDWDFFPESIIWNGKGARKETNQLYRLVKSEYLRPLLTN